MSSYTEKHPIRPEQREAAQREIDRLVRNPPARRSESPVEQSQREVDAWKEAGSKALDTLMELAVEKTGKSREWIMSQWGKEDKPPELSVQPPSRQVRLQRAKLAKCPDIYREAVIEREPIDCQALQEVKKFLAGRRRFLMLTGGRGTFKSGSACYALGQVEGSRYVDALELVDVHMRQPERWQSLLGGHLLVIDDISWEDARENQRAAFLAAWRKLVVNAYSRAKRLIVTGNVTWADFKRDEMEGGYGVLVADRWDEAGVWANIGGESRRREMRNSTHWANQGDDADNEQDDD